MIINAIWSARREEREQAAERICNFLRAIGSVDESFRTWQRQKKRRTDPSLVIPVDKEAIAKELSLSCDMRNAPFHELGFSLGIWDGGEASFLATVGLYSPVPGLSNSAILNLPDMAADVARELLAAAIDAFDPDKAAVSEVRDGTLHSLMHFERGGQIEAA